MDANPKRKAQERADRITAFRAELTELEQENGLVLSPEQRSKLDSHLEGVLANLAKQFGIDISESAKRISWGMRITTLLGSAAFCAGIVLCLHRFWGSMPTAVHVCLLTGVPLLFLSAADLAFRRQADLFYPAILALAAGVAFVMELNALGSILNLVPTPNALLAWGIFALCVAYAYGLRLILAAGLVLVTAYTAAVWAAATGVFWGAFFDRAWMLLPAAIALYSFPWLRAHRDHQDFHFVYRLCGASITLLALLILSKRGDPCCSAFPGRTLESIYQFVGLALSVGVVFHGLRLNRSGLVNLGAVGFLVFLFMRLHAWWWEWMPKYLFFLLLGAIAILLIFPFRRIRKRLSEGGGS